MTVDVSSRAHCCGMGHRVQFVNDLLGHSSTKKQPRALSQAVHKPARGIMSYLRKRVRVCGLVPETDSRDSHSNVRSRVGDRR